MVWFEAGVRFLLLLSVLVLVSQGEQNQENQVEDDPLPDYYAILKVRHTATLREIKKSFRKLAMQYHPDKNKDEQAQDIFKELSEAYSILSDEEKKAEYDELYMFDHFFHEDDISNEINDDIQILETKKKNPEPEPTPEKVFKDESEDDHEGVEEDVWGDLDDETLFKVLKFLADNDYEITKKKIYKDIPDYKNNGNERMFDEQPRSRKWTDNYSSEEQRGYEGYRQAWTPEYRARAEPRAEPRTQGVNYSRYTDPTAHSAPYSRYSDPTTGYSNPEQEYCKTTVSWDGATRVTQRSCF